MAAPHVAGAVTLIVSAEPDLIGQVDQIEELLQKTAQPLPSSQTCGGVPGSQIPNNTFGWGRIDVKAAVDFIWEAGTLQGTVTAVGTELPIAGATISITRNGATLTQRTAADGGYSFTAGEGVYQVKAEAFGYAAQTVTGINVSEDDATIQDFALGLQTTGGISGTVTQSGGSTPVQGATVALVDANLVRHHRGRWHVHAGEHPNRRNVYRAHDRARVPNAERQCGRERCRDTKLQPRSGARLRGG